MKDGATGGHGHSNGVSAVNGDTIRYTPNGCSTPNGATASENGDVHGPSNGVSAGAGEPSRNTSNGCSLSNGTAAVENGNVHNSSNGNSGLNSTNGVEEGPVYTTSNGCPVPKPEGSLSINGGPLLLQDFHLIDLLSHFNRERIPERVVHAKGAGAYGVFEVRAVPT